MKTTLVLGISLMCFVVPVCAQDGRGAYERTYTVRSCSTKRSDCKDAEVRIRVDSSRRAVSYATFSDGKLIDSKIYSGCKFFDSQTWNCEDYDSLLSYLGGELILKSRNSNLQDMTYSHSEKK